MTKRERYLERQRRYNSSEKGLARHRRYNASEKCRETKRARYERLKDDGLCAHCGKDVAITDTRCFDCAGKQDMYNLTRCY